MISNAVCGRRKDLIYIDLPEFGFHYTASIHSIPEMLVALDDSFAPAALRRSIRWKVIELERQIIIEMQERRERAEKEVQQGLFVLCGSAAITIGMVLWVVL